MSTEVIQLGKKKPTRKKNQTPLCVWWLTDAECRKAFHIYYSFLRKEQQNERKREKTLFDTDEIFVYTRHKNAFNISI